MTANEDKPVDREAWRRLLDGDGEGPPELTDARIRAQARRAIAPRTGRWWLPASLAASLLLAVLLVQWQYAGPGAPPAVVSEADVATSPAAHPVPGHQDESLMDAAPPQPAPPPPDAAPRRQDRYLADTPTTAITRQDAAQAERDGRFVAPAPPVVPPPAIDRPATVDTPAGNAVAADAAPAPAAERTKKEVSEVVVTGSRVRTSETKSSTPVTAVTPQDVAGRGAGIMGDLQESRETLRPPEEWYAEIEKLRAAGRKREARRELRKLEAAHPGWLEKNHPPDR